MADAHDNPVSPTRSTKHAQVCDEQTTTPRVKDHKLHRPSALPPQFWDNLPQPLLTGSAIEEVQRRCREADQQSQNSFPSQLHHTRNESIPVSEAPPPTAPQVVSQLTRKSRVQLEKFARHGGPDLKDLRSYPYHLAVSEMSPLGHRQPASHFALENGTMPVGSTPTPSPSRTGPYDRNYQKHLVDHNIFPPFYDLSGGGDLPEPTNLEDIQNGLRRRRPSLSEGQGITEDFKRLQGVDARARNETQVVVPLMQILEGRTNDLSLDVPFTNLENLTNGTLVCARPDLYDGARPDELNISIRNDLNELIVPGPDVPILPNHFLEIKGPTGSLAVATRQAMYAAALGSRGFHALQSYGSVDQPYDNKAYTISWTYYGGTLKGYANHPIAPTAPGLRPTYVMTQLGCWCLTGDINGFHQGVAAYRNGRDWAKLQRDQAIMRANEIASQAVTVYSTNKRPAADDCFMNGSHRAVDEPNLASQGPKDASKDEGPLRATKRPRNR